MRATVLRPWYVLGPGHRWPYMLVPFYWLMERVPSKRETAQRLGLVTHAQMIAALLDIPMLTFAKSIDVADGKVKINRQTEKGYDDVESPLPAVLTVTAGVNEPRYPTFKGIMQAKSKPVEQLKVGDLGLSADEAKATQTVNEVTPAPARGAGEKFEDDGTGAAKVADFLKEAKVI